MARTKSTTLHNNHIVREHHVIDAANIPLGRLASNVAAILIGKNKTGFIPHLDLGDTVEIKNPEKVVLTGIKSESKQYHNYSGYPGGIKSTSAKDMLALKPKDLIRLTVKNMLPKNSHQVSRLKRLTFSSLVK